MTVAIFGGSGFIGRHLQRTLQSAGIDYRSFGRRPNEHDAHHASIDFEEPATYRDRLDRVHAVVLLVSQTVPGSPQNDLEAEIAHNVVPHAKFLQVIASSSIEHVVFVSSGGQIYGAPAIDHIDEACPAHPLSAYGAGKLMIENELITGLAAQGRSLTILRPSNPTGEGQVLAKVGLIAKAVHSSLTGHPLEIWGDGSVVRDYFDVVALADAIFRSLTYPEAKNEVFNVGSGVGLSVNDAIRLVEEVGGRRIETIYKAGRIVDVPRNVLSVDHIRTTLGWTSGRDLPTVIRRLIAEDAR